MAHWKTPPKNPRALQKALSEEAKSRATDFLSGVLRYLETPYARVLAEKPAIWRKGNARLLDYGTGAGTPVLFIPSLINRYYILDLKEESSFLRFLATQGIHPLVLDWGVPGETEKTYGTEAYIKNILLPALEFLHQTTGEAIHLVGYCMGGVLSLAAAQLAPGRVASLSLLATPWDFHCKAFAPFVVDTPWQDFVRSLIEKNTSVPADVVQSLFYITDPFVFEHKFRRFCGMPAGSPAARDFVALEHWVNDGVPMTAGVAKDCLIGWAQMNQLLRGKWQVAGKKIEPQKLKIPTFIAIPQNDHVVPQDCAWPLAAMIKSATIIHPSAGHVGMIVGQKAKKELWQPFAEWVRR